MLKPDMNKRGHEVRNLLDKSSIHHDWNSERHTLGKWEQKSVLGSWSVGV